MTTTEERLAEIRARHDAIFAYPCATVCAIESALTAEEA